LISPISPTIGGFDRQQPVGRGCERIGIANGRRKRVRRGRYWCAGCVSGGLDHHPTGLMAECLLLLMFDVTWEMLLLEGGCCLREVFEVCISLLLAVQCMMKKWVIMVDKDIYGIIV